MKDKKVIKNRGPFESLVDLNQIPSYQTRFMSMDKMGGGINMDDPMDIDPKVAMDACPLKEKLGSFQDVRTNPGIILRRWGMRK